jgi:hypothetical protein
MVLSRFFPLHVDVFRAEAVPRAAEHDVPFAPHAVAIDDHDFVVVVIVVAPPRARPTPERLAPELDQLKTLGFRPVRLSGEAGP